MSGSGLVGLIVRMLLSLTVVMAVIGVGYVVARRRANGGVSPVRPHQRRSGQRSTVAAIEVVGRAGLARGSMAIALRFGDSVILVGVSEQAPATVLQEIDAARWDELHSVPEVRVPTRGPLGASASPDSIITTRPTFIEALKEATARRA